MAAQETQQKFGKPERGWREQVYTVIFEAETRTGRAFDLLLIAAILISVTVVVLSSVAGERVRPANPVYGGTKAGLDGFCQGYGDWLAPQGVRMLVVRPGFVRTAMTEGMAAAPLATTAEKVADVTVKALRGRRRTVWAPPALQVVFSLLRHLPGPIWRRLPLS